MDLVGCVDLVPGEMLGRDEPENIEAADNLRTVNSAVVPIRRPVPAEDEPRRIDWAAIEERDLDRPGRVREIEHGYAALIPRLHHDVASGNGNQRPVVRHAVLLLGLRRGHLVIARKAQLAVDDIEYRIRSPRPPVRRAAPGAHAAAPLVGEDHFRSVRVERRRVPIREVPVGDLVDSNGTRRIRDIEQDAVTRARARGQADLGKGRDVVALVGFRRGLRPGALVAAPVERRDSAGLRVGEDARPVDDACALRRRERYLDDVDAE